MTAVLNAEKVEERALNAKLVYNNITRNATTLYAKEKRNVLLTKLSSALAVVCGGVSGVCFYYQYSSIHRVWRIRHQHTKVKQLTLLNYGCLATGATILLFLISPLGFISQNEELRETNRALDRAAVQALLLWQNYATLYGWSNQQKGEDDLVHYGWREVVLYQRNTADIGSSLFSDTEKGVEEVVTAEYSPDHTVLTFRKGDSADALQANDIAWSDLLHRVDTLGGSRFVKW
ncbi:hypothetical protein AGDE_12492 [Angomonas deanei]|uniref:Uncharacterized protein n=1 Tax=Angomonas deanei TaxID=59799 RepID=A0A7G2CCB2_9TRYP|nr:hypothetical protein AGDE_12492 [Angomonas deanei]CAD2217075.1 hypothetical protein, conserved [Angomonas deanei]|eukprot:EPY24113.1 hypothetical protein AGDE_12492 [Angomonas deanei]